MSHTCVDIKLRMSRQRSSTEIYYIILKDINRQIIFEANQNKGKFLEISAKYNESLEAIRQ